MSLLTVPFNPYWASDVVAQAVARSAEARAQAERLAANERQQQQQQLQQTLADQRRAFEFDRRSEFDRAKDAQDESDKTRAFDENKRRYDAENAPASTTDITPAPVGLGQLPVPQGSAGIGTNPLAESDGTGNLLNYFANSGESDAAPALSLAQPSPFGNAPAPILDGAEPTPAGDVSDVTPDIAAPSLIGSANAFGGSPWQNPAADSAPPLPADRDPAGTLPTGGAGIGSNPLLPTEGAAGSLVQSIQQAAHDMDTASVAGGVPKKELVRQRERAVAAAQSNFFANQRKAAAAPAGDNLFDSPVDVLSAIDNNGWDASPEFDRRTGKYFPKFNSIGKSGPTAQRYSEISGWPLVGGLRVDPDDPATRYVEKPGARSSSFTLATDKFHNVAGKLVRIPGDGGEPAIVEGMQDAKAPSPTVQKMYLGAKTKLDEAESSLAAPFVQNNLEFKQRATDEVTKRREAVAFLEAQNPSLRMSADDGSQPTNEVAPAARATATKIDPQRVFKTEAEARSAGAKSGDIVTIVNPATGKPARARLY